MAQSTLYANLQPLAFCEIGTLRARVLDLAIIKEVFQPYQNVIFPTELSGAFQMKSSEFHATTGSPVRW